jgi:hypothetical protein
MEVTPVMVKRRCTSPVRAFGTEIRGWEAAE